MMIEKVKEERTEKAIKRIHSSMEELNKPILEIMKRQRKSGESERTYMTIHAIFLTMQLVDKDNSARQKIIDRMVQTTLAAQDAEGIEAKESEDEKDKVEGRNDAPNTQVDNVFVTGS